MSEALALAPPSAALPPATRGRKADTRERLLDAAHVRFCEAGYVAVSVEDIAVAAGVTRMTFYRHFPSKAAVAIELYRTAEAAAMPRLLSLRDQDAGDPVVVRRWIGGLFEADRGERRLQRAFNQAAAVEPLFIEHAQRMIATMIRELGRAIPAFAVRPDVATERARWLQAWLVLYEILDQGAHAALQSGVADDPLVLDILTARLVRFTAGAQAERRATGSERAPE